MARKPVYHLEQCHTCEHRHVCKFIDKIDNALRRGDLPLDLTNAECNEYLDENPEFESPVESLLDWANKMDMNSAYGPIHNQGDIQWDENGNSDLIAGGINELTEKLKPFLDDNVDDMTFQTVYNALQDTINNALQRYPKVSKVAMSQKTMDVLAQGMNFRPNTPKVVLIAGQEIPILVKDGMPHGIIAVEVEY